MKKKWKSLPRWSKIISFSFLGLILAELILRFIIGLGDLAVYREDKDYEYFYVSDQDVWRFGNHIVTNEFGMRSKKVDKKKKLTILEFGDSVLNGGAHVDQEDLATTIEEKKLNEKHQDQVQILNVSAQSWGLSNAFAFLKKHGDFNSKIILLVFSSHDLNDNMHFKKVVGEHKAWPSEKPWLALTDAWSRFVWPPIKSFFDGSTEYDYLKDFDDRKVNPGWKDFMDYAQSNQIKLMVYLHASQTETNAGSYNEKGKKILRICKDNNLPVIQDLEALKGQTEAYIDDIHMNAKGHSIMASLVLESLSEAVEEFL